MTPEQEQAMSTSRAYVESDPIRLGVRLALTRDLGQGTHQTFHWGDISISTEPIEGMAVMPPEDVWLRLPDDDARAIYEALGDYFGHAGHDIRSLRKDYDAERSRVDKFIAHLTGATR